MYKFAVNDNNNNKEIILLIQLSQRSKRWQVWDCVQQRAHATWHKVTSYRTCRRRTWRPVRVLGGAASEATHEETQVCHCACPDHSATTSYFRHCLTIQYLSLTSLLLSVIHWQRCQQHQQQVTIYYIMMIIITNIITTNVLHNDHVALCTTPPSHLWTVIQLTLSL